MPADDFESQVIAGLARITERQANQHTEVIGRLDKANGRLDSHDDEIKDLVAHKNRAIGYAAAIGGVVTLGLAAFEYVKHLKP